MPKNIAYYLNRDLRGVRECIKHCQHNIEFYERAQKSTNQNDVKELYEEKIANTNATLADMLEDEKLLEHHLSTLNV